jgi:hypothetical protein
VIGVGLLGRMILYVLRGGVARDMEQAARDWYA